MYSFQICKHLCLLLLQHFTWHQLYPQRNFRWPPGLGHTQNLLRWLLWAACGQTLHLLSVMQKENNSLLRKRELVKELQIRKGKNTGNYSLVKQKPLIELSLYTTDELHPFHGSSRSTFAGWTDGCCVFIYSSMCCPCIPASKRTGL